MAFYRLISDITSSASSAASLPVKWSFPGEFLRWDIRYLCEDLLVEGLTYSPGLSTRFLPSCCKLNCSVDQVKLSSMKTFHLSSK